MGDTVRLFCTDNVTLLNATCGEDYEWSSVEGSCPIICQSGPSWPPGVISDSYNVSQEKAQDFK